MTPSTCVTLASTTTATPSTQLPPPVFVSATSPVLDDRFRLKRSIATCVSVNVSPRSRFLCKNLRMARFSFVTILPSLHAIGFFRVVRPEDAAAADSHVGAGSFSIATPTGIAHALLTQCNVIRRDRSVKHFYNCLFTIYLFISIEFITEFSY